MRFLKLAVCVVTLVEATGCAFGNATLNVAYDRATASKGPISAAGPELIRVAEFDDSRPDTARIGYKRNMYGWKTADILTEKPVPEIVADAVAQSLEHNGKTIAEAGNLTILGDVTQFWFEVDQGFWTVKFSGSAACDFEFVDSATGMTIYENSYIGNYEKKAAGGLEATWAEVMTLALHDLVDAMIKDPRLVAALKALGREP